MATNMTPLLDGPAGVPPPGVVSQLDDPPNEWGASYVFPAFSIALASVLVAMRLYTTVFVTQRAGLPDLSIGVAWAFFVAFATMCIFAVGAAPGVHMWNVRLKNLAHFLYWLRLGAILYAPTICWIKLSILSQYIQIFMPNRQPRPLYWATIFLMFVNVASYIVLLCMEIWSCKPIRKAWDPLFVGGHCFDTNGLNVGATAVNVASDSMIFLLPQAVIWRLHMPTKQKVEVSMVFFVAILAIAAASTRLRYAVILSKSSDATWISWLMGMWGLVEMDIGIVVACLPATGAFCRNMRQSTLYVSASRSLKGLTSWKRMTDAQDSSQSYAMATASSTLEHLDPYLVVEGSRQQPATTSQGISWVKSYGVSESDTLATFGEADPESRRGVTPAAGYHVSVGTAFVGGIDDKRGLGRV